jgi:hypothetical protein
MLKTHAVRIARRWGGSSALALLCGTLAVLALAGALAGCSGNPVTGTSGDEGTINPVPPKEGAPVNEAVAKKAKLLGGMGQPPGPKGGGRQAK